VSGRPREGAENEHAGVKDERAVSSSAPVPTDDSAHRRDVSGVDDIRRGVRPDSPRAARHVHRSSGIRGSGPVLGQRAVRVRLDNLRLGGERTSVSRRRTRTGRVRGRTAGAVVFGPARVTHLPPRVGKRDGGNGSPRRTARTPRSVRRRGGRRDLLPSVLLPLSVVSGFRQTRPAYQRPPNRGHLL
jgi:hypothetical protein